MSASTPEQSPEPQPERSGSPPKPPKKTARGLEDDSADGNDRTLELVRLVTHTERLNLLLTSIRGGSQGTALDVLETDLAEAVLELRKLVEWVGAEDQEIVIELLRRLRDYRRQYPLRAAGNKELWKHAQEVLDEIK